MKKTYILTDGVDAWSINWMTEEEFMEAQEKAELECDGEFYWVEVEGKKESLSHE